MVVAAADDQVRGRRLSAVGNLDGPAIVDQAEVDQVIADLGGQFPAADPVRGHQQHVLPVQIAGNVGADGLVHDLVRRAAADSAVLVVLIQHTGVPARSRRQAPCS